MKSKVTERCCVPCMADGAALHHILLEGESETFDLIVSGYRVNTSVKANKNAYRRHARGRGTQNSVPVRVRGTGARQ